MVLRTTRRQFLRSCGAGTALLPAGDLASRFSPLMEAAASERPAPSATVVAEPAARLSPFVRSVRYVGVQFRDNSLGITGQDGATSIRLPDGRSLWTFGDTIEGPFDTIRNLPLGRFLSSSAALVDCRDPSKGITTFEHLRENGGQKAREIIAFHSGEQPSLVRLWPVHGTCVGGRVYLCYHKIALEKDRDVFDSFELLGMGLARAEIGPFKFTRLVAPDGTHEFWKGDQPGFGVFVDRSDDGYLYLWGSLWTGMFLARVRPASIEDLSSYEYLVEAPTRDVPQRPPRWDRRFAPTAPLFDSVPNEMSAAYNPHLGRYLAVHSLHREHSLVLRTAPRIFGPWSEPQPFYQPTVRSEGDLIYAAKEHPELASSGGRVLYVTYVDSAIYMPELIEVTLA